MSTGRRAENRERQAAAIIEAAERLLATQGAAGLTLRGLAAEVGMVPSGIYRYHAGIDGVLTTLIIRAYDAVGLVAEQADAAASGHSPAARVLAVAHAVRRWALDHRDSWALIYGSPVPGYVAPRETVGHASRVADVLFGVLRDAAPLPPDGTASEMAALDPGLVGSAGVDPALLPAALDLFTTLVGGIGLELFGHLTGVVVDPEAHFDALIRRRTAALVRL